MIKVEYSHESHGQEEPPGWELLGKVSTVHETTSLGLAILGIILLGALAELVLNDKYWNRFVVITVTIPKVESLEIFFHNSTDGCIVVDFAGPWDWSAGVRGAVC